MLSFYWLFCLHVMELRHHTNPRVITLNLPMAQDTIRMAQDTIRMAQDTIRMAQDQTTIQGRMAQDQTTIQGLVVINLMGKGDREQIEKLAIIAMEQEE